MPSGLVCLRIQSKRCVSRGRQTARPRCTQRLEVACAPERHSLLLGRRPGSAGRLRAGQPATWPALQGPRGVRRVLAPYEHALWAARAAVGCTSTVIVHHSLALGDAVPWAMTSHDTPAVCSACLEPATQAHAAMYHLSMRWHLQSAVRRTRVSGSSAISVLRWRLLARLA